MKTLRKATSRTKIRTRKTRAKRARIAAARKLGDDALTPQIRRRFLAALFGVSEKAAAKVLRLPPEKLVKMEDLPSIMRFICSRLLNLIGVWLGIRKHSTREDLQKVATEELKQIDFTLARMAREMFTLCQIQAKESSSDDLVCDFITHTLAGLDELPAVWRQYERLNGADWGDPDDACTWGYHFPAALSSAVAFFQKLCDEHPEHFRLWASEKPYLPMLVFRNKTAYRDRFTRQADSVNLGANCLINVSENALFRFADSPINAFVFDVLLKFQEVFDWIVWARKADPEKQLGKGATFGDLLVKYAEIPQERQPLFLTACKLPRLTKKTAKLWAEKAVTPYLEAEHHDWNAIPALAPFIGKAGGRAKAKEAVFEALLGMAKPEPSETCPSFR